MDVGGDGQNAQQEHEVKDEGLHACNWFNKVSNRMPSPLARSCVSCIVASSLRNNPFVFRGFRRTCFNSNTSRTQRLRTHTSHRCCASASTQFSQQDKRRRRRRRRCSYALFKCFALSPMQLLQFRKITHRSNGSQTLPLTHVGDVLRAFKQSERYERYVSCCNSCLINAPWTLATAIFTVSNLARTVLWSRSFSGKAFGLP